MKLVKELVSSGADATAKNKVRVEIKKKKVFTKLKWNNLHQKNLIRFQSFYDSLVANIFRKSLNLFGPVKAELFRNFEP